MIKAVIFDLNGIFIKSPKLSDRFEKDFGVAKEEFLPKLGEIMDKTRQSGAGPSFKYWQEALNAWKIGMSEQDFWNYWFGAETVSESMVEIAKMLKSKSIKVFLLSNNFMERAEYYAHYPWLNDSVDKLYFSWQTGFVKPDPNAWQTVMSENNLKPEECLYFDDQEKNIIAARSLGIKAFVFEGEEDTLNTIREYFK